MNVSVLIAIAVAVAISVAAIAPYQRTVQRADIQDAIDEWDKAILLYRGLNCSDITKASVTEDDLIVSGLLPRTLHDKVVFSATLTAQGTNINMLQARAGEHSRVLTQPQILTGGDFIEPGSVKTLRWNKYNYSQGDSPYGFSLIMSYDERKIGCAS